MPFTDQDQERRIRRRGWLQTAVFLGAAAILGAMLYTAVIVQSNRRALERAATAMMQTQAATSAPRPIPTAQPLGATVRSVLRSTPLPSALLPIAADSAAQVAEVARWGRGALRAAAWSPDGSVLAVGTTIGVFLGAPQSFQELRFLDTGGGVGRLAFSSDGQVLAAISKPPGEQGSQAQRWRVADGSLVETIPDIPAADVAVVVSGEGDLLLVWIQRADDSVVPWQGGAVAGQSFLVLLREGVETRLPIPWSDSSADGPFAVALSPDGRLLAASMPDRNIYLYQVADGLLLATLEAGISPAEQLAFAPNGRFLAAASPNSGVRVWQVTDGSLLYVLDEGAAASGLAFSNDGRRLAVLGGGTVRLYGVDSGALVRVLDMQGHDGAGGPAFAPAAGQAAFSPDDQLLAVGVVDGPLRMFQTGDGRLLWSWPGFGQALIGLALSGDGSALAVGVYPEGAVWLWDVARAVPRQVFHPPEYPASPEVRSFGAFSPDGQFLALVEKSAVALWRVTDGTVAGRVPPEAQDATFQRGGGPLCTAFSPDGQWLAVGYQTGRLLLWQMASSTRNWLQFEVNPTDGTRWCELAFSPDGQYLAALWWPGSPAYLLRVPDGTVVHRWEEGTAGGVAFSPDGRLLAVRASFDAIAVLEVASGNLRHVLSPAPLTLGLGLAFSPEGSLLAGGSAEGPICLWRADDGALLRTLPGHVGLVTGLAFSSDGRQLFSASVDGTVRVWGVR